MAFAGLCLFLHAKPEKLGQLRDTVNINDCLLRGKMENIQIKLAFKSVFWRLGKGRSKNDPYSEDDYKRETLDLRSYS